MLPEPRVARDHVGAGSRGTIGVIFGGANSEHEVSIRSARSVVAALATSGWRVRLLGIDRAGAWHAVPSVDAFVRGTTAASADHTLPRGPRDGQLDGLDVVFPVLHGRGGEDGTVQGALELAGLPYVGCGVLASALAMDKRMAARMLEAEGIPVVDTRSVTSVAELDEMVDGMPLPLFIKPNRAGSSVGAARVDSIDGLAAAVRTALLEDSTVLVQPLVVASEVSIGVLERAGGVLGVTGASLLRLGGDDTFFSYDGKYGAGAGSASGGQGNAGRGNPVHDTRLEIPAILPSELLATLQGMALVAFDALGCSGLARVDFFVTGAGEIFLNEVNTMPGFARHSHYLRLWESTGLTYRELVDELVDRALSRSGRLC